MQRCNLSAWQSFVEDDMQAFVQSSVQMLVQFHLQKTMQ